MKKQLITLLLLSVIISGLKAQIPNTGFENLNPNGTVKNWGPAILMAFAIDSAGNPIDSLKMDQGFCFSSSDAYSGQKALEMRNAEWKNSGEVIPGRARLSSNDSDFFAYSNPPVSIGAKPLHFSFYFKYFPVNGDTAYASMSLSDSSSNEVGTAFIEIAGTHSLYTLATTSVVYTSTIVPAFVAIDFRTAKLNSPAHYGTRFVVDDVSAALASLVTTGLVSLAANNEVLCFPNPATHELNFILNTSSESDNIHLQLISTEGKRINNLAYSKNGNSLKISTEELAPGLYFLNFIHEGYTYTAKFTKTE